MTNIDKPAKAAEPIHGELVARVAEIANAFANQTREQAMETMRRMMPAINDVMQRAASIARATVQAIAEWLRNVWPALYWSPEVLYEHGTAHQRHIAWRQLKRIGINLPNPAHRLQIAQTGATDIMHGN